MVKKRLIFTLLYDSGYFVLSRNFRLQRVGDINWLNKYYDFNQIAFFIDELVVLDITRGQRDKDKFLNTLKQLTKYCFTPISVGGGIKSISDARDFLCAGADKLILNTAIFKSLDLVRELSSVYGQQCIVASLDLTKSHDSYDILVNNGSENLGVICDQKLSWVRESIVGEIYINSVDRDGTGQGYDLNLINIFDGFADIPLILAGGVGNAQHLLDGASQSKVDAVATANLYNFIGDALKKSRDYLRNNHINLATWPESVND